MKKLIAVLALAAAATPALASDGSETVMHSWAPGHAVASTAMSNYAFAPAATRHNTTTGQWQVQSPIIDR